VSTTKPTTALTPGAGGGSLTLLDPHTGSIQSSLRVAGDMSGKASLGVASLSFFPSKFANTNTSLAIGFGSTNKKDDTYAMLFTIRSTSLPPILHWKCRLPEPQLSAGLLVSPCGHYIIGGGSSGAVYVWTSLGGNLLQTVKAHYRSIAVMDWTPCGRHLVTGGADGMVHVFSLLDLVDCTSKTTLTQPIRTWSKHHLPVTALAPLTGGRMASASSDGQVVLIEVFSEAILATIQLPHAIQALITRGSRLYAGSNHGTIYMIDLDDYAMYQTAQQGATVKRRRNTQSAADRVFAAAPSSAENGYQTDLKGHDRAITALSVLEDKGQDWLCSGDEAGTLRIWDLESRGCVRIIQPWSHSSNTATKDVRQALHPVTSIRIITERANPDPTISLFSTAVGRDKNAASIVNLVTPLQKFIQEKRTKLPVPFLQPRRDQETMEFWDVSSSSFDVKAALRKRKRKQQENNKVVAAPVESSQLEANVDSTIVAQPEQEIERLQRELHEARSTIERWENVNNKLMAKLQQK